MIYFQDKVRHCWYSFDAELCIHVGPLCTWTNQRQMEDSAEIHVCEEHAWHIFHAT